MNQRKSKELRRQIDAVITADDGALRKFVKARKAQLNKNKDNYQHRTISPRRQLKKLLK